MGRLPLVLSGGAFANARQEAKIDWLGSTIDPANLVLPNAAVTLIADI